MKYSSDKSINEIAHRAFRTGLVTPARGTNHWSMERADGNKFFIPGTPSDFRAYQNWKSALRRWMPELLEEQPKPSRPLLTLPKAPTEPKPFNPAIAEAIAEMREYDVDALQLETTKVDPEVTKAAEPTPLEYLDALSDQEIEAFLASRKARAESERNAKRQSMLDELELVDAEIDEVRLNLQSLLKRQGELKLDLGMADRPMPAESKGKFEPAFADPVFYNNGTMNMKATAEKHGVPYLSFIAEVKKRNVQTRPRS